MNPHLKTAMSDLQRYQWNLNLIKTVEDKSFFWVEKSDKSPLFLSCLKLRVKGTIVNQTFINGGKLEITKTASLKITLLLIIDSNRNSEIWVCFRTNAPSQIFIFINLLEWAKVLDK